MPARVESPRTQAERFAIYLEGVAATAGHADRIAPLTSYATGLLLPGERKSVEPMAARLAPTNVRRMHQSLHHVVAEAPWDDDDLLRHVRHRVLPAMTRKRDVVAWVVDDTGSPKKGRHSVGVARQYCGQLGKQDNCRVAVSLSVSTWTASLPIAWRLYLPEAWTSDRERRRKTGIPATVQFQTKPQIALAQIRQAVQEQVPAGLVLADAAYGNDAQFRQGLTALELSYLVGVGVETVRTALTGQAVERARTADDLTPTLGDASARLGENAGAGVAARGVETGHVAHGQSAAAAVTLYRGARPAGASGRLAVDAASRRMARHRMAAR